jgi:hypothetical protein
MYSMVTFMFSEILTEGINNDNNDAPFGHDM